eukprot:gnl/Hemi2/12640_TR4318_c0_g1_i1.p1 gnl/Hemi2/12640_TR4318_c0_g1~~gnl/Hemi2/12640_TR4318_c0_g1_i1.p1  ORF type:complete len:253 (-),score=87.50 gnl/Hemi2/12640_TR4318_c0_g1_i1:110-868(-)
MASVAHEPPAKGSSSSSSEQAANTTVRFSDEWWDQQNVVWVWLATFFLVRHFSLFSAVPPTAENVKEVRKRLLNELGSLGIVSALLASLTFGALIAGLVPSSAAFASSWGAQNYALDTDWRQLTVEERFTLTMIFGFVMESVAIGSSTLLYLYVNACNHPIRCLQESYLIYVMWMPRNPYCAASAITSMVNARHGEFGYVYVCMIVAFVMGVLMLLLVLLVAMHASKFELRDMKKAAAASRLPSATPSPRSV